MTVCCAPPDPLVSVVVVNWNGASYLPRCLDALAAQTFRGYEVLVVDNGSTDGSAENLQERWPAVQTVRLGQNAGFAIANNLGARLARGRWLALVNNDAYPAPDWLESLVGMAAAGPEYAFFASRLVQEADPARLDGTGDVYHVSGLAWRRHYNKPADASGQTPDEVFGPCAAAAMYLRQAFWQVGGFDEDFRNYYEDVDLGFRLRLQGFRCLYVPEAIARHVGSASHGKTSDFAIYHTHRNLVWTYFKDMPVPLLWKSLPAHILVNLVFLAHYSLGGHARAVWQAKWHALRGLRAVLRKRQAVQRANRVSAAEIGRFMDHGLLSPYLPSLKLRLGGGADRLRPRTWPGSSASGD